MASPILVASCAASPWSARSSRTRHLRTSSHWTSTAPLLRSASPRALLATASVASSALGLADLNRGAVLVQCEDVRRCRVLEERADQGDAAQLATRIGDAIGDVESLGCVAEVQQLHDAGARQLAGDGLEDV